MYNFNVFNSFKQQDIYHTWATEIFISRRGPDVSELHTIQLTDRAAGLIRGCVLHLRGDPTPQPVIDSCGNALLWNGEIFDGINVSLTCCVRGRCVLAVERWTLDRGVPIPLWQMCFLLA